MRAVITLAIGSSDYAQMAISLGCAITEVDKICIYSPTPKLQSLISSTDYELETLKAIFDHVIQIPFTGNAVEQAHLCKLQIWNYVPKEYEQIILLDADMILNPAKSIVELFDQNYGNWFVAYTNDEYDFDKKKRTRDDYTFWCEPEVAKKVFDLHYPLPMINASFIYADRKDQSVFNKALEVWNTDFECEKYKDVKSEEMCFNIACSMLGKTSAPHVPYRPFFFQYQQGIPNHWDFSKFYYGLGLAGNIKHSEHVIALYNSLADYFRHRFGLESMWHFTVRSKKKKPEYLTIEPLRKRTIIRRGELPNSEGGIYNPSGVFIGDNEFIIARKEHNYDAYQTKLDYQSFEPLLIQNFQGNLQTALGMHEMKLIDFPFEKFRVEDFRIFDDGLMVKCTHTIIYDGKIRMALSQIDNGNLIFIKLIEIPLILQPIEKNWVYCKKDLIYGLNPFTVIQSDGTVYIGEDLEWFDKETFLANSTIPIKVDGMWLMWFHSRENGIYFHGAMLFDDDYKILHQTKHPIKIDACDDGLHKGLIYVSGCALYGNTIRVYYGEGDAHSCYIDYNKDELLNLIKA